MGRDNIFWVRKLRRQQPFRISALLLATVEFSLRPFPNPKVVAHEPSMATASQRLLGQYVDVRMEGGQSQMFMTDYHLQQLKSASRMS